MSTNAEARAAFGEPAPPARERRRSGVLGFVVAGLLALAAIGGAVAWFVHGFGDLGDKVDALQRIAVPGRGIVHLEQGAQSIYFESAAGQNARVPRMLVAVEPVGGGPPVALHPTGSSVKYSLSHHSGRSILGFDTDHAGAYVVSAQLRDEAPPAAATLAVGRGVGHNIVKLVLGGLGILFGGLILAAIVFAITLTRRRRGPAPTVPPPPTPR